MTSANGLRGNTGGECKAKVERLLCPCRGRMRRIDGTEGGARAGRCCSSGRTSVGQGRDGIGGYVRVIVPSDPPSE